MSGSRSLRCAWLLCVLLILLSIPVSGAALLLPATTDTLEAIPAPVPLKVDPDPGLRLCLIRRYPSGNALVIGTLEHGTKVTVLETSGQYYQIDCYDMKGFILKSQVLTVPNGECYVNCDLECRDTLLQRPKSETEAWEIRETIGKVSKQYQGVPYVWGGSSPKGFDCSGFTQYVLRKAGVSINRTAINQMQCGVIIPKEELQCGDLVFFSNTGGRGFASHVGIYLGDGLLIHSGSSRGVYIVGLESSYFANHYQCARRMVRSILPAEEPDAEVPLRVMAGPFMEMENTCL